MRPFIIFCLAGINLMRVHASESDFPDQLQPEEGPFVYPRFGRENFDNISKLLKYIKFNFTSGVLLEMNTELCMLTLEPGNRGETFLRNVTCPQNREWNSPSVSLHRVSFELASQIDEVWLRELKKVKYCSDDGGAVGGIIYHFYAFSNRRGYSGIARTVGNPKRLPELDSLLEIVNSLWLYSKAKEDDPRAEALLKEFAGLISTRLEGRVPRGFGSQQK